MTEIKASIKQTTVYIRFEYTPSYKVIVKEFKQNLLEYLMQQYYTEANKIRRVVTRGYIEPNFELIGKYTLY